MTFTIPPHGTQQCDVSLDLPDTPGADRKATIHFEAAGSGGVRTASCIVQASSHTPLAVTPASISRTQLATGAVPSPLRLSVSLTDLLPLSSSPADIVVDAPDVMRVRQLATDGRDSEWELSFTEEWKGPFKETVSFTHPDSDIVVTVPVSLVVMDAASVAPHQLTATAERNEFSVIVVDRREGSPPGGVTEGRLPDGVHIASATRVQPHVFSLTLKVKDILSSGDATKRLALSVRPDGPALLLDATFTDDPGR
ncbi:hypothetical protein [Maioricimonas rarisocia]|nr:hypothetical protein [Maioricimonas rarisocia]